MHFWVLRCSGHKPQPFRPQAHTPPCPLAAWGSGPGVLSLPHPGLPAPRLSTSSAHTPSRCPPRSRPPPPARSRLRDLPAGANSPPGSGPPPSLPLCTTSMLSARMRFMKPKTGPLPGAPPLAERPPPTLRLPRAHPTPTALKGEGGRRAGPPVGDRCHSRHTGRGTVSASRPPRPETLTQKGVRGPSCAPIKDTTPEPGLERVLGCVAKTQARTSHTGIGRALDPIGWVLISRGESLRQTHRGEATWRQRWRQRDAATIQGAWGMPGQHQRQEETGEDPPAGFRGTPALRTPGSQTSAPQNGRQ